MSPEAAAGISLQTGNINHQTKADCNRCYRSIGKNQTKSEFTISDFLKLPGLYKLWFHTFKPPEELSNKDHHVIL